MSEYFLGVDGGQSGTAAVIGDAQGKILGWGTSGPCDHVAAPEARAKFLRVMRECVGHAAAQARLAEWRFRSACFGLSGGPDDKASLVREVVQADRMLVTHDAAIALAGATGGAPGVVVISGTGSIAFGENARGETARSGGWGFVFGDEGSAFDIARQALRAIMREYEGWGARTALTPALLEATGCADANEMLHRFYTPEWPRSRVAKLAQMVDSIARESAIRSRSLCCTTPRRISRLSQASCAHACSAMKNRSVSPGPAASSKATSCERVFATWSR